MRSQFFQCLGGESHIEPVWVNRYPDFLAKKKRKTEKTGWHEKSANGRFRGRQQGGHMTTSTMLEAQQSIDFVLLT